MRLLYTKPALRDLSQGSRIAFVRQLRLMSQHTVADKLGLQHDNKRRIMTRYEKGDRNPKDDRTLELAKILNVEFDAIKKYDFKSPIDLIYVFMWLEELYPKMNVDLGMLEQLQNETDALVNSYIKLWKEMKQKREKREITYEEYIEWKLTFEMKEVE